MNRWFYLDIEKCLDDSADRDEAVVLMPESRLRTSDFGRSLELDLTTREREFDAMMFPLSAVLRVVRVAVDCCMYLDRSTDPRSGSAG